MRRVGVRRQVLGSEIPEAAACAGLCRVVAGCQGAGEGGGGGEDGEDELGFYGWEAFLVVEGWAWRVCLLSELEVVIVRYFKSPLSFLDVGLTLSFYTYRDL